MAKSHLIEPFPIDINREYFAAWLSGFTDGEGCFRLDVLNSNKNYDMPHGQFLICLRKDDIKVLQLIQSFLGCGSIADIKAHNTKSKPLSQFRIVKIAELFNVIVKHFDQYPLIAKKKRDFCIFKKGISLMYEVSLRPHSGRYCKWTDKERSLFIQIKDSLKKQREYDSDIIATQEKIPDKYVFEELF